MTFARPALLLALLALPALWLLSRRLRARRDVLVSSLLIWRRLDLRPDPPRESRRRADRLLLLRLAAAGVLALGLAGPELRPADAPPELVVVVDVSPSMAPFGDRVAATLDEVRARAPDGVRLRVVDSDGTADLPSVLAGTGGDVVFVTDHRPPDLAAAGRLRLALVGRPVANAGFVSAWMDGEDRFGAVIANFSDRELARTLRSPGGERALLLPAGGRETVAGPAPGGRAELSLGPPDDFAFDDRVVVAWRPAVEPALAWRGPEEPHVAVALGAAGLRLDPDGAAAVAYRVEPEPGDVLVIAPPGPRRAVAPGGVSGAGELPEEAVPGPEIPLGPVGPSGHGDPLLVDAGGPIATREAHRVTVGLDPGDPASAWTADPSFPVFIAAIAPALGARSAGTEIPSGRLDPDESATVPESAPADLAGLEPSPPDGAEPPTALAPWLYFLAVGLLLLHLVLEEGRRASVPDTPTGS